VLAGPGYHFDETKIGKASLTNHLTVTEGQMEYEWAISWQS